MDYFEIAFSGEIEPGVAPEQARQRVQKLFNASEQLMQQLFSGQRVIIKQKLDEATALKYQKAFAMAGAILEVRPLAPATTAEPSASQTAADSQTASKPTVEVVPRDLYMATFTHVQAPDYAIAPVGVDLSVAKEHPEANMDLSAISLAPIGSDLAVPSEQNAAVDVPDTSHIQLASREKEL